MSLQEDIRKCAVLPVVRDERSRRALHFARAQIAKAGRLSLINFVKLAWHVVEPSRPYIHGRHAEIICLPADTLITTEAGEKTIGEIVNTRWSGDVLSYNHQTNTSEWQPIRAWMKSPPKPLTNAFLSTGGMIRLTGNHPVYVEGKGYVPAESLQIGDTILRCMPKDVWLGEVETYKVLQSAMLRQIEGEARDTSLSNMRGRKGLGSQSLSDLLFQVSAERQDQTLQSMRQTCLSQCRSIRTIIKKAWRFLQHEMLCLMAARKKQSFLYSWQICSGFYNSWGCSPTDFDAGQTSMFPVQGNQKIERASFRSQSQEQRELESRSFMHSVSQGSASKICDRSGAFEIGRSTISKIEKEVRLPEAVYNIEVGRNNNYFANGVLVHNCEHLEALGTGQLLRLLINLPPGFSKEISVDEPVLTRRGRIRLGNVVVGDQILTHKGRYRKVEAVHEKGSQSTLTVTTNAGRVVKAELTHPFLTPRGWISAKDLIVGDVLAAVTPIEEGFIDQVSSEEARLLGYLIGDGSVTHSPSFTNMEPDVIADFIYCANKLGFIAASKKKDAKINATVLGLRGSLEWLEKHGIKGKSSYTKRIPPLVLASSKEVIANFIGAYWSCDGSITVRHTGKRGGIYLSSCTSVSKDLANDIQHALLRLGIDSRIRHREQKLDSKKQPGGIYQHWQVMTTSHEEVVKFRNMPGLCARKNGYLTGLITQKFIQGPFFEDEIISIVPSGMAECRCLTVAEDHSFTVQDLAVHNSLLTAVFFPAWQWGPNGQPFSRYIGFSYDTGLSTRDALRCRRLMLSDWYQALWGSNFQLLDDGNMKTRYENNQTGFRISDYVGGGTGERGDVIAVDDPNQVKDPESDAMRTRSTLWLTETMPTRMNDPEKSAIVIIQHRLHAQDMSGEVLARDLDYEHICLPMEYEPPRCCYTSLKRAGEPAVKMRRLHNSQIWLPDDWKPVTAEDQHLIGEFSQAKAKLVYKQDFRTQPDELLFPARFPREIVERDKHAMGVYAVAGQFQQRPSPRGGGLFKRFWFEFVEAVPNDCQWVRRWDLAATCLVAGTMVETITGPKAIETIKAEDFVLTRKGYRRVTWAGQSGLVDKVVSVEFTNGSTLTGTPEHRVWTENKGWMELATLDEGCCTVGLKEDQQWQTSITQIERGVDTNLTQKWKWFGSTKIHINEDPVKNIIGMLENFCIAICGGSIAERFLKGMTFIILMMISTITQLKILIAYLKQFICEIIPFMDGMKQRLLNSIMRELQNSLMQMQYSEFLFVNNARRSSSHDILMQGGLDFVQPFAEIDFITRKQSIAEFVKRNFGVEPEVFSVKHARIDKNNASVNGAGRNSWSVNRPLGRGSVVKVAEPSGNIPVYDITVESEHEFFANGILVHNSGAGAYTAGVLMGRSRSTHLFYIRNVVRQQLDGDEVKKLIRSTAAVDMMTLGKANYSIGLPQDPGQAGKVQARDFLNLLAGYDVRAEIESGDKETRARPLAAQAEAGNVKLLKGHWVEDYLRELEQFPAGKFADQVDASSGAFGQLLLYAKQPIRVGALRGQY